MTIIQKLRYTKITLLNLFYTWTLPKFGLRLTTDASVGYFLRMNNKKIYKRYFLEYSDCGSDQDVVDLIDSLLFDEE